jgi:hypothetical protein
MRVAIISGGRDYEPTPADLSSLDTALKLHEVTHVIHGACEGADMACHKHLKERKVWLMAVPAPWAWKDKGAGPARNAMMADIAEALTGHACWQPAQRPVWILFSGGKGTSNAAGLAEHGAFEVVRIGGGDA